MEPIRIRHARESDLPAIVSIYNHAIETSVATFDVKPYVLEERVGWFAQFGEAHPMLVAEAETGEVAGFAYFLPYRPKAGYERTKETTIYLAPRWQRVGIGSRLYEALIAEARHRGVHALVAVLGGKNEGSIALHERLGFRLVGHFPEVGFKFGAWVDTFIYLLLL